jgi:hypothetical protein
VVDAILRCIEERRWTVLVGEKQGASEWEEEADSLLWGRERVLGEKFSETDRRVCGEQPSRVLMDRVKCKICSWGDLGRLPDFLRCVWQI